MNLKIEKCQNCSLYKNQAPLLDNQDKCDVMWVGLSAKKVNDLKKNYPLEENTNSGKIIKEIEEKLPNINFYKTNLVKCLPLNEKEKIRYPNKIEMQACISNLLNEINYFKPKIIFLLGNNVANYFNTYINHNNIIIKSKVVSIMHPSYIYIYQRKNKDAYINNVVNEIIKVING